MPQTVWRLVRASQDSTPPQETAGDPARPPGDSQETPGLQFVDNLLTICAENCENFMKNGETSLKTKNMCDNLWKCDNSGKILKCSLIITFI